MTETNLMTTETADKRDELRAKIEASERRIAERTFADEARDAAGIATKYAKDNPLTVVGGAIAAGLLIGLMTRPGRRVVKNAATGTVAAVGGAASGTAKSVKTAAKTGGGAMSALFGDALVAYGVRIIDEVMDGARAGQDKLEDFGDAASASARKVAREANYVAGSTADKSRALSKKTGRRAGRVIRDLTKRMGG